MTVHEPRLREPRISAGGAAAGTGRWQLDPDRLLPADREVRAVARDLYALVADRPILSPHGHVHPGMLAGDTPFADPASLFIERDHYVTRLLHAAGVDLESLGVGGASDARETWRTFSQHWHRFAGTASGYWLSHSLSTLFELDSPPSEANADRHFDGIAQRLSDPDFRPRALFERFGIEVLATTDDPMDDLEAHAQLAADPTFTGRVLPTFRPDGYIDPEARDFVGSASRLAEWHGSSVDDLRGYLDALEARRHHFVRHGAVSADHGVADAFTTELERDAFAALHRRAVAGALSPAEARLYRGAMLLEMARMSVRDGLVMTLHPGVLRNHSPETHRRFGADTGHDIPISVEFTRSLQPLLARFGNVADFHLVLFTIDESTYSREIAPLAGFYPSVLIGAPWWFLDAPDAMQRFRAATTETAGFYRGSGFIDDTRAFLSIPARHDVARRVDASFLARLVREGRLSLPQAERIAVDLVDAIPRHAFKL